MRIGEPFSSEGSVYSLETDGEEDFKKDAEADGNS